MANAARNQNDQTSTVIEVDGAAGKRLKSFIERIERLEEEKAGLATDIKDIYAEAKSVGFDVKTMRALIRLRKMEDDKRQEADMLLETYKAAIGMD
jgi:uncharacterized protein (UPF0335 family)